jgi:hypothetical protein
MEIPANLNMTLYICQECLKGNMLLYIFNIHIRAYDGQAGWRFIIEAPTIAEAIEIGLNNVRQEIGSSSRAEVFCVSAIISEYQTIIHWKQTETT